ncbi:MAG: hypothetical protein AABY90_00895 [Nitrospirota bacterium]|jgi:hypothetical protein
MNRLLHIAGLLALVFVAAVLAELPPMPALAVWIQEREWYLMLGVGGVGVVGFTLMMGGILKLLMDQDESLSHADVEDVERSVRLAARPVAWRASSYRILGKAVGRQGSESFKLNDLKAAWRTRAVWHDPVWRRRLITTVGALMLMVGLVGFFVVIGPPWIKVLMGGALLYVSVRLTWGFWQA